MSKLKVVAYARVSTEMQEKKESLETQVLGIERFCNENNYELIKIHTDVMSGGNRKRKGFNNAMKDVDNGNFDVFLAYDLSRIARDTFAFLKLFNKLREKQIKLVLINNQNLNSDSPLGELILTILASIFQFFRFDNAEKVRYSMAEKVKNTGNRMAGMSPFGYKMIDKQLVIQEDEADIIKEIFKLFSSGKSIGSISKLMKMSPQIVRYRLSNPVYTGKNIYGIQKMNKDTFKFEKNKNLESIVKVKGSWDPLISENIFFEAQKRLNVNKEKDKRYKDVANDNYLLGGLLSCSCGGRLNGATYEKKRFYYKCKKCGKHIKRDELENALIKELLNTDDFNILNTEVKKDNDIKKALKKIENDIKNLDIKENRMLDFLADGTLTKDKYQEFIEKNNNEKGKLLLQKIELEGNKNEDEEVQIIDYDTVKLFKAIIQDITTDDRADTKLLFRQMINEITINTESKEIEQIKFNIYKDV